jgi:hypothetical protein
MLSLPFRSSDLFHNIYVPQQFGSTEKLHQQSIYFILHEKNSRKEDDKK